VRKAHTIATLICLVGSAAYTSNSAQAQAETGKASPQEHLNRAADAVLRLKSAQFTLTREGAPAFLDEKNGITFTAAQCSYAAPDRVSCNVRVSSKSGSILQLTRVWVPEGTFQSNPLTRQFAKAPLDSSFNGVVLFARTGIPEILQTSVQKPQPVGNETIRDKSTLHLRGEVRGEKLNPLMGSTLKPEVMYPVDLWMEEQSATPVRIHVAEPEGNGWMIELFSANEPVDIPTPKVPPATPRP
jgi:LppX/LprAFG-like lipoprotein